MKLNDSSGTFAGNPTTAATATPSGLQRIARLIVLLSGPCLVAMIFTVLPPVLPGIAQHFGGGSQGQLTAQMIMTLPSIGLMIGGPLVGWLIDRIGPRLVLFGALAAYAALGSAGLYLDGRWLLLLSRFILGFAGSALVTACGALLCDYFDAKARARFLGYGGFFGAGTGLGSILLSGVIAETGGWHAPCVLYLVALVVLAIALFSLPAKPVSVALPGQAEVFERGALLKLLPLYLLIALVFVATFMTSAQVSFLLAADGVTSPAVQSQVIGMASLGSALGSGVYGWIRAAAGHRRTFVMMLAMLGIGILTLGTSHTPAVAAIGCAIAGFGGGLTIPHFLNMVLDRAHEKVRSRALGLAYSSLFLGDLINPLVMAPVTYWLGIHGAFMAAGAVLACGALYTALRR